ncbi:hypothetical protein ACQ4LE_006169 [Meloidogyne hapla]|uniref:Uncharacterized protein n=1 Tax=Meloidogyne hapla TaxID=6305 RepID=A0A1I8B3U0_MELHA
MAFKITSKCAKSVSSYSSSFWIFAILSCYFCLTTMFMTNVNGQIILSPVDDKRNFNREFLPFGKRASADNFQREFMAFGKRSPSDAAFQREFMAFGKREPNPFQRDFMSFGKRAVNAAGFDRDFMAFGRRR